MQNLKRTYFEIPKILAPSPGGARRKNLPQNSRNMTTHSEPPRARWVDWVVCERDSSGGCAGRDEVIRAFSPCSGTRGEGKSRQGRYRPLAKRGVRGARPVPPGSTLYATRSLTALTLTPSATTMTGTIRAGSEVDAGEGMTTTPGRTARSGRLAAIGCSSKESDVRRRSAGARGAVALLSEPVRAWFESAFPEGPTPGQELAWPAIAAGEHVLLIAPTGTGKTLAAFLAVLDRLFRERRAGTLGPGLRCVYVSPLRSLNYDIERNLAAPLEGIARRLELGASPIRVGVRTGDTSAYERRKLRDDPPHILITTPESLSLLLSQEGWQAALAGRRAPDRRRGPCPGADQAGRGPGRLARASRGAGRSGPLPRGAVGHLPRGRVDRAVPGRPIAGLPRHRGAFAPRHAAAGIRRREPDPARRGAPPRPELSPAAPPVAAGHRRTIGPPSSSPIPGRSPRRSLMICGSLGARLRLAVVSGQWSVVSKKARLH